ncbi:MAG TPA: sugar transferase [Micromonosporaceae bacterium]|jgi:exopolysaccharide biosynthesis polyprenyl glycosylphosphotransferase|nr:sugar transferase [Micromonosporaceae bacterium]
MGVAETRRAQAASGPAETAIAARPAPRGRGPGGEHANVPPRATYVAADAAAITVSLVIAHLLRFGVSAALLPGPNVPYVLVAVFAVPVWLGVLALAGCYDRLILGVGSDEYRRVLNGGVHFLAVVALAHFLGRLVIARGYVGVLIPVTLVLTLLARFALRLWLHRQRRGGRYVHRLLLVGTARSVVEVGQHLVRSEWSGFLVVGVCVATERPELLIGSASVPVVGAPPDVAAAVADCHADAVAVTTESQPGELPALLGELAGTDVTVLVAPAIADVAGPRTVVRDVAGLPLLHVAEPTLTGPQRAAKEVFDRVGAALALLVLAPVFVVIAAAVRLDSPGPVFFRQTRVGRDGRRFSMVKFRTMVVDADRLLADLEDRNEADGLLFKMRADPRVTRTGRVLRRYSLDELPQIINVVRGEMSMVGPRPPLPAEVERYEHHVTRRLLVKPGITGLWQVSGRSDLPWDEAVRLDLYYVHHWSPTMDLTIMAKTFSAVLRAAGAY